MNITTTLLSKFGDLTGLLGDGPDGGLGLIMSGLAGTAAALAVAIALTVYFHTGYRTLRDVVKHGVAAMVALALVAFVVYDMRHAAMAYLGINPSKSGDRIRNPHCRRRRCRRYPTPRSSSTPTATSGLPQIENALDATNDQSVLRGVVTLDYRTTERVMVLNLAGRAQCEFKLRLAADPSRSEQFGPWHLADRVAFPDGASRSAFP